MCHVTYSIQAACRRQRAVVCCHCDRCLGHQHAGVSDDGAGCSHLGVECVEREEGGGSGKVVDAAVLAVAGSEDAPVCAL